MDIQIIEWGSVPIAEVDAEGVCIRSAQDAHDVLVQVFGQGINRVVMREEHFDPAFFDLRTRLAGEILQKFVTYGVKLAIVGDFEKYTSRALRDFMVESNRGTQLFFVTSRDEALQRLAAV